MQHFGEIWIHKKITFNCIFLSAARAFYATLSEALLEITPQSIIA